MNLNESSTVKSFIALVIICLVVPCNVDGDLLDPVVSRTSGLPSLAINALGMQEFKHHIFTSPLDTNPISRGLTQLIKTIIRGYSGAIGARRTGTFLQHALPPWAAFPCNRTGQRSQVVPDSVHQLRPGDIDIVAAMGDSVTVGTGANSLDIIEVLNDQRGLSFSGGGYRNFRTHLTVPNILKEFNPRLFGYALGDAWNNEYGAQFNIAENAAGTTDMPFQARKLLQRMSLDRRVDMKKHWKLLTIMVGTNDFCSEICYQAAGPVWMNREIERSIIKALRIIRDGMPRTLVNLVTHPSVSLVISMDNFQNLPTVCYMGRLIQCSCLQGNLFTAHRRLYRMLELEYRTIFQRVARRPEFHRKDFTVVFQPFGVDATVFVRDRWPDISIMGSDCLHISQKGHAVMANGLWNNMMQPDGQKTVKFRPLYEEFICPTEQNPYINTYFNS